MKNKQLQLGKPEISVLMPIFNAGRFLKEAVDSILNQTFSNFELLILDDGSTDKSLDIISSFTDNRIHVFSDNKNKGIVHQLNKGLHHAKAPLIARMDADDIAMPNRLKIQKDLLDDNTDIEMVASSVEIINEKNEIQKVIHQPSKQADILFSFCRMKNPFYHPSVMYRKRSVKEAGGYRDKYLHMEDFDLWFRLYRKGIQMSNIEKVLLQYRVHNHQISITERSHQVECLVAFLKEQLKIKHSEKELKAFLDIVRWHNFKAKTKEEIHFLIDIWGEMLLYADLDKDEKKALAEKLIQNYFENNIYAFSSRQLIMELLKNKNGFFHLYFKHNLKERLHYKLKMSK